MPECGCGCGTELNQRKDGSYPSYAPGGHDAKHKSALINTVIADEDPKAVKAAMKVLESRNWVKFLEKKRATLAKRSAAAQNRKADPARNAKNPTRTDNTRRFGLTERDITLLENPPTEMTWYCTQAHGYEDPEHPDRLVVNNGKADACWFCHTKRPNNAPLLWPLFEEALRRLTTDVDMEAVIFAARYDQLGDTLSWKARSEAPDDLIMARKIHWLHKKWIGGGLDETTEEVTDGAEVDLSVA